MDTIKEYWTRWLWRDALARIITVNFIAWLALIIAMAVSMSSPMVVLQWVALPRAVSLLPARIWTVLTYMFVQADFLHLLVNMLWLMLFGQLFLKMQGGPRLVALYVFGGLCGALAFLALELVGVAAPSVMIGSSCAVLAVVGAVAALYPAWHVNLLIIGEVRIVWLAVAAAVFFVVLSAGVDQAVAHGAGLLAGVAYGIARKHGTDILQPALNAWEGVAGRRVPTARPVNAAGPLSDAEHRELDSLLAKVGRSGYASLSASERQRLFNLSQRAKARP